MNPRIKTLSFAVLQAFGASVALTMVAAPALAQQQTAQTREKIEVTGSSIKRTVEEQSLPVIVFTREEINRTGAVNVEQLMQLMPAMSTLGATTGSQLSGLSTYGLSSASLRGLGGSRTLVLINGRRVVPFAQSTSNVDINSIPVAAIDRIEVLTDGASSVYGSDAIAGVINFILRRDFTGVEVSAEYGKPTRSGGGKVEKYSAVLGYGNPDRQKFNVTLAVQERKEESLLAADRDFSRSGNNPPFYTSGATPSGRIEGVYVPGSDPNSNLRSGSNPFGVNSTGFGNPGRDAPGGCEAMLMFPNAGRPRAPSTGANCNFDSAPFVSLFPKQKDDNVYGTLSYQFSPAMTVFAEGLWNKNKVTNVIQPSPIRFAFLSTDTAFTGSGVDQALLIFPGNPAYPSAWLNSHGLSAINGRVLAITNRAFMLGNRSEEDTNTETRGVLGLRGTVRNWDYELSALYDKSKSEGTVFNGYFSQLNVARIINTVGNTAGTYWDPWAAGGVQNSALTTALQAAKYVGPTATAEQKLKNFEGKASGTFMEMANGPLAVAAGVGVRKEDYTIAVPDILLQGDIAGLGGATLPQNGKRTVDYVYGEVNVPILRTLEANFSGRVDHYDDLQRDKSPVTGKVSLRWNATPNVLVRGSAGRGFRAPSMGELHTPQSLGTSEEFVDPRFPDAGPIQSNAIIGGAPELKPEKTRQHSIGVIVSPVPSVTLKADLWRIKIDNYITTPAALAMVNAAIRGSFIFRPGEVVFGPGGPADGDVISVDERLANAATADFRGWDLGAGWRGSFPFGRLALDYNATYYTRADLQTLVGTEHNISTLVDENGNGLALPVAGGVLLRYKHIVSLNWSSGPWSATVIQNYWGRYETAPEQVTGNRHFINAFETYDVQGEWTGLKWVKLAVGARNVFDRNPPVYIPVANYFQFGYDPSIYDPRGRFVYGRLTFSFR